MMRLRVLKHKLRQLGDLCQPIAVGELDYSLPMSLRKISMINSPDEETANDPVRSILHAAQDCRDCVTAAGMKLCWHHETSMPLGVVCGCESLDWMHHFQEQGLIG